MRAFESITICKDLLQDVHIGFSFYQERWVGKVLSIQEVSACDVPTGIPHVPVYIRGSINIAGWVAPVLDIHQYCGLTPQSLHTSQVAVVQFDDNTQEQLMRHVTECFTQPQPELSENQQQEREITASTFIGISIVDGQLVVLMDADKLVKKGILAQLEMKEEEVV